VLGRFFLVTFTSVIGALWFGLVLMAMWAWFVAPVFQLRNIGLAQGAALVVLAEFLCKNTFLDMSRERDDADVIASFLLQMIYGAVVLVIGFVFSLFA
jgi:hypothetical protein